MNATELIAIASGTPCRGEQKCFYCGNPSGEHAVEIGSSFNDWSSVAYPNSESICSGCKIAFDEKRQIAGRDKLQKVRNWSWMVTDGGMTILGSPKDIRQSCLVPPSGRFAIAVAVSGQKHILWRAPVNQPGDIVVVQMEMTRVVYRPDELDRTLQRAKKIVAASGKPALTQPIDTGLYVRLAEAGLSDLDIMQWFDLAASPLSQLAAFICPPKEECCAN